jgi:hypothetical protein
VSVWSVSQLVRICGLVSIIGLCLALLLNVLLSTGTDEGLSGL